jgi:epoxyqueuosine reductase
MSPENLHNFIAETAKESGFLAYGAIPVKKFSEDLIFLNNSIKAGYNASMGYLSRNTEFRENPAQLLEGAESILVFLAPYKPSIKQSQSKPKIASYAYGLDYHHVIKARLHHVAEKIKEHIPGLKYRVFTDSAPIFERAAAKEAGLGFIGRNTFLISREHGLHTFIGIIITNAGVYYNNDVVKSGCGTCRRCIEICPSGALVKEYTLDSNRCISYRTIEDKQLYLNRDDIVDRAGWIFGCDLCLEICPWSKIGMATDWEEFIPLNTSGEKSIIDFSKEDWSALEEEEFNCIFKNSPISRAGYIKVLDNLNNI